MNWSWPPISMRRNDEPSCDLPGDSRAVVAPDEMQPEIDPRGASGRGQDLTFIHVEDILVDLNVRVSPCQFLGVHPVSRDSNAVREARRRKHERSTADREQAGAILVRAAQLAQQRLGNVRVGLAPAGNEDRSGVIEKAQRTRRLHGNTSRRLERTRRDGARLQFVPRRVVAAQAEEFDQDTELESTEVLVGQEGYLHRIAHGRILVAGVNSAKAPAGGRRCVVTRSARRSPRQRGSEEVAR